MMSSPSQQQQKPQQPEAQPENPDISLPRVDDYTFSDHYNPFQPAIAKLSLTLDDYKCMEAQAELRQEAISTGKLYIPVCYSDWEKLGKPDPITKEMHTKVCSIKRPSPNFENLLTTSINDFLSNSPLLKDLWKSAKAEAESCSDSQLFIPKAKKYNSDTHPIFPNLPASPDISVSKHNRSSPLCHGIDINNPMIGIHLPFDSHISNVDPPSAREFLGLSPDTEIQSSSSSTESPLSQAISSISDLEELPLDIESHPSDIESHQSQ